VEVHNRVHPGGVVLTDPAEIAREYEADPSTPWSQRPGETNRAYSAFLIYRDLGPSRTITECARQRYPGKCSRTKPHEWARVNAWHERVAAWDAHLQAAADKAETERFAQERIAAARERLETGRAGVNLVKTWIRALGDPSLIPAGTIPSFLKVCADLARIEDGLSTEQIGGTVRVITAQDLSDDELARIAGSRSE